VRVEIVAIGTELLLGQIVDTNSATIADELARCGMDCNFQTRVGDNHARIVSALRIGLDRADAIIVCGGLGPTQDDITREAIAEVMGVELRRDSMALEHLERIFSSYRMEMPESNLRQADVPAGAVLIPQLTGTAPGLICPVGDGVIYAVPGVPAEMEEMLTTAIIPDLQARSGDQAVIASRTLRTVGIGEAKLSELVAPRLEALDREGAGAPTIAFLANLAEGVKVRITVKAPDKASANRRLAVEEAAVREILTDAVYGLDDETLESVIGALLRERGLTLAVAESFTGGLIASRIVAIPGASAYFRGGIVAYDPEVKFSLLGVPRGPVISEDAAVAMAEGVRKLLGADVAIATTGVAGPAREEGQEPGTVFLATALSGAASIATAMTVVGSRSRVRDVGALRALNLLRRRLLLA
jgi:nicotinamide-nucleotide amidase